MEGLRNNLALRERMHMSLYAMYKDNNRFRWPNSRANSFASSNPLLEPSKPPLSRFAHQAAAFGSERTANHRRRYIKLTSAPMLSLPFKGVLYYKIDTERLIKCL